MVNLTDKQVRFARWCLYFAKNQQARAWKHTLRDVVGDGRAKVSFRDMSQYRVELVWLKAVAFDSAAMLVRLAKEK